MNALQNIARLFEYVAVGPFRVPHLTKHKQMRETATESLVVAMVWEAIETLGFRDLLKRLAGLNPKIPSSQPFRVCEAECV